MEEDEEKKYHSPFPRRGHIKLALWVHQLNLTLPETL